MAKTEDPKFAFCEDDDAAVGTYNADDVGSVDDAAAADELALLKRKNVDVEEDCCGCWSLLLRPSLAMAEVDGLGRDESKSNCVPLVPDTAACLLDEPLLPLPCDRFELREDVELVVTALVEDDEET